MHTNREEVFDWAATEWPEERTSQLPVYQPQPLAPTTQASLAQQLMQQPKLTVHQTPQGIPFYVQELPPQPLPAYDPIPARRTSMAFLLLGGGIGVSLVELSSWVFFKGLDMAQHAIVSLAIVAVSGAVSFVIAKLGSGIRVSNVRIGDNSNFSIGKQ